MATISELIPEGLKWALWTNALEEPDEGFHGAWGAFIFISPETGEGEFFEGDFDTWDFIEEVHRNRRESGGLLRVPMLIAKAIAREIGDVNCDRMADWPTVDEAFARLKALKGE